MRWLLRIHPSVIVLIFVAVALLPFSNKSVHIDDPLYLWTAEHLIAEPGQVFKFSVNWSGTATPMAEAVFNPPGAAYYAAFFLRWFGGNEVVLHVAFFLIGLSTTAGVFTLAQKWCKSPALATAMTIATPIFLVSATTLMCDMLMLMLWIWALVFWEQGLAGKSWYFLIAGFLAGCAVFAKYNGILLLPLFVVASYQGLRNWIWILAGLMVTVLMLWAYEVATAQIHGRGLFSLTRELSAAKRAMIMSQNPFHLTYQVITLLTFLGGGMVTVAILGLLHNLHGKRVALFPLAGAVGVGVLVLVICASRQTLGGVAVETSSGKNWSMLMQIGFWAIAGALILIQAGIAFLRQRDRVGIVLTAWLIGGVAYAIFMNWMVSGRGLLWIMPAIGILTVRQLDQYDFTSFAKWKRWLPVAVSGLIAIAVTVADTYLANSGREAARVVAARHPDSNENGRWFQGHWGFQYYMQKAGWRPIDFARAETKRGDWIVTPCNNVKILMLPPEYVLESEELSFSTLSWLTTLHPDTGGAFHANQLGPLPFYFGTIPQEIYLIQRLAKPIPALQ